MLGAGSNGSCFLTKAQGKVMLGTGLLAGKKAGRPRGWQAWQKEERHVFLPTKDPAVLLINTTSSRTAKLLCFYY